jgi:nitrite reductase/ring-hydroxylating ferredoxin subunit
MGEFEPEDMEVECPLHGSRFSVVDGSVRILPATRPVDTYPVKIEGDLVMVGPRQSSK